MDEQEETKLKSRALHFAAKRLRATGESVHNVGDAIVLLEQLADDPCAEHCGDEPICKEHEKL